ncbi:hypothetical protein QMK19_39680 [Streptomyces sp. H10-C2]|uniref:hypothetical protein n=1 Tax=unclassified Streptomyces TaxID=2593676 RepID=UPI0024B9BD1A|nr:MULTISPECIES: hypothetical protein [unclassified Streptomyces]MDJ0346510.1 hypothetical protein [Streptomyces sp. PH10-H1]MDJ0375546.1 hypothetical protein [Streptomyces sp. H10-C2]
MAAVAVVEAAAQQEQCGRVGDLREVVQQVPQAGAVRGADSVHDALDELAGTSGWW